MNIVFAVAPTGGSGNARPTGRSSGSGVASSLLDRNAVGSDTTSKIRVRRNSGGSATVFNLQTTVYADLLQERFEALADRWDAETGHLSQIERRIMHPCYQQIIAMGPAVLPVILRRLRDRPDHWFWALSLLAPANPIPPGFNGTATDAARLWVEWGERSGYLPAA